MLNRIGKAQTAAALVLLCGASASAQIIEGDAIGEDNLADPRYYGVSFLSAGPAGSFVESVSFDISADLDGFFDLDGTTNFGGALEPVVQVSSLVGLNPADITWSFVGNHPNLITANFAHGSFGVGDSFRFACETDLFVADPCKGGNFSTGGAIFSVVMENGPSISTTFALINVEVAIATADFSNCAMDMALPVRSVLPGELVTVEIDVKHNAPWVVKNTVSAAVIDSQGQALLTWNSPEIRMVTGSAFRIEHDFLIPEGTPPGIYKVAVGLGQMRQGHLLRSMEFRVESSQPVEKGGAGVVPQK